MNRRWLPWLPGLLLAACSTVTVAPVVPLLELGTGGRAGSWVASDGSRFGVGAWRPPGRVKVVVVAVHGLSGAATDFAPLGENLARRRTAVYAFDLRGQGLDPVVSRRGNLRNLDDGVRDLGEFTALVRQRHPRARLVWYGESMGALICLHAAGRKPAPALDGLVLASPVIDFKESLAWWQNALFRAGVVVAPQRRLDFAELGKSRGAEIANAHVTRDRAYEASLEKAPHALNAYSLQFIDTLFRHIRGSEEVARSVTVPTLILYAGHDVFIQPVQVERVAAAIPARDKTLRLFPDAYHLLLHDDDRAEVLVVIDRWLAHLLK